MGVEAVLVSAPPAPALPFECVPALCRLHRTAPHTLLSLSSAAHKLCASHKIMLSETNHTAVPGWQAEGFVHSRVLDLIVLEFGKESSASPTSRSLATLGPFLTLCMLCQCGCPYGDAAGVEVNTAGWQTGWGTPCHLTCCNVDACTTYRGTVTAQANADVRAAGVVGGWAGL